jgi:hypothetical protein
MHVDDPYFDFLQSVAGKIERGDVFDLFRSPPVLVPKNERDDFADRLLEAVELDHGPHYKVLARRLNDTQIVDGVMREVHDAMPDLSPEVLRDVLATVQRTVYDDCDSAWYYKAASAANAARRRILGTSDGKYIFFPVSSVLGRDGRTKDDRYLLFGGNDADHADEWTARRAFSDIVEHTFESSPRTDCLEWTWNNLKPHLSSSVVSAVTNVVYVAKTLCRRPNDFDFDAIVRDSAYAPTYQAVVAMIAATITHYNIPRVVSHTTNQHRAYQIARYQRAMHDLAGVLAQAGLADPRPPAQSGRRQRESSARVAFCDFPVRRC